MESVKKARERLWGAYPKLLAGCAVQAANYGQCVAKNMGDVAKNQCQAEFELFKECVQQNAKKMGTRL